VHERDRGLKIEASASKGTLFPEFLKTSLKIGNREIPGRLVLAPMSKLGNLAFRELLESFGGYGLLFSEMAGARSVPNGNGHMDSGFMWRDGEQSGLVCQIFGSEPDIMATAARRIEDEGFFGVDINFGCAVSMICRRNCGAALLKNPPLAGQIVHAVRKAVSIPVFVKFRTGWQDDPDAAADIARRFQNAGADALTFHPRVAPDRRTRPPKWEYIAHVKAAVQIPVFGNGNVFDIRDCEQMMQMTGCDGVAIGRLAAAKPWVFAEWTRGFIPPADIYRHTAMNLLELLQKYFKPAVALRRFNTFAAYFSANFRFGHAFNLLVHRAGSIEELREILSRFFETPPDVLVRPNISMLR
jgi:nifR3 family TIM-barrel protein